MIINENTTSNELDNASVRLVDTGMITLSGSRPLLYEWTPIKNTINIIINISISPASILIKIN